MQLPDNLLPRGSARLTTKEKRAAPSQITAEQLLRESAALQSEESRAPSRRLVDEDELNEYRIRKRKGFEDSLRRKRYAISIWLSYALWEAEQKDFRRARSVFERTLEIDPQRIEVWTKYLDMECQNQFINSARNLFDRVCHFLPRIDYFWLRYTTFEEALQNYDGARRIFEKWMEMKPDDRAWIAFVKFEERCSANLDNARAVLDRFLTVHPRSTSFVKFATWEEEHGNYSRARAAFEKAIEILPPSDLPESFFLKFAKFEENHKHFDKAKEVYLAGLKLLGAIETSSDKDDGMYVSAKSSALKAAYVAFQRRSGGYKEIESTILDKRRQYYEDLLKKTDYYDYDVWLNLIRMEESNISSVAGGSNIDATRAIYERFALKVPPVKQKAAWKRFFYIYLSYALFEELVANDMERAAKVWATLLDTIPHKVFSFAKFWKHYAHFEIRRGNLQQARLIFGRALAEYPVRKVFQAYADMELKLGELDRCRKIYARYIEIHPTNPHSWLALIDLELLAQEHERARKLFEMAIAMPDMQNIEVLWKAYIDVEANLKEFPRARELFETLIKQTGSWKVFQAYADFEFKTCARIEVARQIFERGINHCKEHEQDPERALLIDSWLRMEKSNEDQSMIDKVKAMVPKKIKKRRTIVLNDGSSSSIEEYTAYIFPDEANQQSSLAILEAAKRWKKRKKQTEGEAQQSVD